MLFINKDVESIKELLNIEEIIKNIEIDETKEQEELKRQRKKRYLKKLESVKKEYFNTTANELHKKPQRESIFTDRFITLLRQKLGKASDFIAKSEKERKKLAENVHNLFLVENDWNALVSKVKHEEGIIKAMYPEELQEFLESYDLHFFPPAGTTHKQSIEKYSSTKCYNFCIGIIQFLIKSKVSFIDEDNKKTLQNFVKTGLIHEVVESVISNIDVEYLFTSIVKIFMKKAYENSINIEDNKMRYNTEILDEHFLFVKRTDVLYPLQHSLVLYFTLSVLRALRLNLTNLKAKIEDEANKIPSSPEGSISKGKVKDFIDLDLPTEEDLVLYLNTLLKDNGEELLKPSNKSNNSWFRDTFNVAIVLIDLFCQTGLVIDQEVQQNTLDKSNVIIWLNHKLENTVPFSSHLPRIIAPKLIDAKNSIEKFITPYRKGDLTISPSKQALQTFNLSQAKPFRVNKLYRDILYLMHNTDFNQNDIITAPNDELPFPTEGSLKTCDEIYENWGATVSISPLQKYINKRTISHLSNLTSFSSKDRKTLFLKSFDVSEISRVESNLNYVKKKARVEYNIVKSKRQLLQTSLTIANIYEDFPLYYGTKLDYRTRMYPWEYLLSRTTGELKQLLQDYLPQKLTQEGLIALMDAYYRFSMEGSLRWSELCKTVYSSKNVRYKKFKEFFQNFNYSNKTEYFSGKDMSCYLKMLHNELCDYFSDDNLNSDKEVSLFLEIDQVCSGITLMSVLLGNPKLAAETNLLGGPPRDIYLYVMSHIEKYFSTATYTYIDPETKKKHKKPFDTLRVMEFLMVCRSCVKAMLMQWGYSQGSYKRSEFLISEFKLYYKNSATDEEYRTLRAFAEQFDDFLESLFPNIQAQKQYLIDVLNIRLKAGSNLKGMSILTLDGCALSWSITPMSSVNKAYWNPVLNKSVTYKVLTPTSDETRAVSRMQKDYERGLFPNLIHSIDAAIMRTIIFRVWKTKKYIVNQLHDCVLCNPNIVNTVYNVIEEIYTDGTLHSLADKTFFIPMKEGLNVDDQKKIDDIRELFHKNGTPVNILKGQFNPRHAYVMEGTVRLTDLYARQIANNSTKETP